MDKYFVSGEAEVYDSPRGRQFDMRVDDLVGVPPGRYEALLTLKVGPKKVRLKEGKYTASELQAILEQLETEESEESDELLQEVWREFVGERPVDAANVKPRCKQSVLELIRFAMAAGADARGTREVMARASAGIDDLNIAISGSGGGGGEGFEDEQPD